MEKGEPVEIRNIRIIGKKIMEVEECEESLLGEDNSLWTAVDSTLLSPSPKSVTLETVTFSTYLRQGEST